MQEHAHTAAEKRDGVNRFETVTMGFSTELSAVPGDSISVNLLGPDGRPVPSVNASEINPRLATRYSGLYDIQEDLRQAIACIKAISKLPEGTSVAVSTALLVDAAISYGRCFATAEGRGGTKIENGSPWISEDTLERRWHAELMKMRNTLFAHAGDHYLNRTETIILMDSHERPKQISLFCMKWNFQNLSQEDHAAMAAHFEKVLERVSEKLHEVGRKLEVEAFERLVGRKPAREFSGAP